MMEPMYDVRVLTTDPRYAEVGWGTDMVTSSNRRAKDRARFLVPRVQAVEVRHQGTWERISL